MTRPTKRTCLALALTLVAAGIYAYRLGTPSLRGDESFTAIFCRWELGEILRSLRTTEPHPPLYYVFLHYWMRLMGRSEFILRFPSAITGMLLVPLIYALGRGWRGERVGLWGAALVALNPFLLWHGQDARMYTILAATGLGSIWLGTKLLSRKRRPGAWLWLAYVACALASLATHYYAVLVIVAQDAWFALLWLRRKEHRRELLPWITAQIALAACFAPWLVYAAGFMLGHSKDWIPSVGPLQFLGRLASAFSVGTTFPPRLTPLWAAGVAGLFCIGLASTLVKPATHSLEETESLDHQGMLLASLLVPLALTFLGSLARPMFDERYLITLVPLYLLIAGAGIAILQERLTSAGRWGWLIYSAAAILLLGPAFSIYQYHHDTAYAKSPNWREAMEHVADARQRGDLLVLNYPDPTQEYYNQERIPYLLLPDAYPPDVSSTEDELAALIASHPRLWLVPTRAENWDRDALVETWLSRHADLVGETPFQGLRVQLYNSPATYAKTMVPLDARLAGSIALEGYDLRVDGMPLSRDAAVAPGSTIEIVLYWRCLEPVDVGYTVFTHLKSPDGVMRGQMDAPPFDGHYPTNAWEPGEKLVSRYRVAVDPSGPDARYELRAGMYLWPSLDRAPVVGASSSDLGDSVLLASIDVGR
jgi:mannosyltransferase